MTRARPLFGLMVLASLACDAAPEAGPDEAVLDEIEGESALPVEASSSSVGAPAPSSAREPDAAIAVAPEPEREPLAIRIARQQLILRAAADPNAALRGRIPLGEAFEVFAFVDGPECGGKGWGELGNGAFACLEATRKGGDDAVPRELPELRDPGLAPFFYGKLKTGGQAFRWKNVAAWQAGDDPIDELEPEHDYAFVTRRRASGEIVLIDDRDRVVLEKNIARYRPSRFEGRDLLREPIPADRVLAWGITWPENPVMAEPSESARVLPTIDYQAEILVLPEPVRNAEGVWWVIDGGGHIHNRSVRRFQPMAPPEGIAADETWIDVELESQTLTVMRGADPLFTTLVSTGFKGPTPRGLFRISMKQAIGQMQSRADAEEQYNVEAVPFVQYFSGNFALHGAFWHYRFGHKISHGCVNLSPKDARRVYQMTSPRPRGGWLYVYEGETLLGSTVRVRKGEEQVIDKREPVRLLTG